MDLKIKDVAQLLSVSETTIRRWLLDGKIPAYKLLNRQYRFSRIEVEDWIMKQKIQQNEQDPSFFPFEKKEEQIYPQKGSSSPQSGNQQYSLYRALHRGGILTHVAGETKEQLIRNAVPTIAEKLQFDADVLSELLLDRERLMPTALNNGVAVPHARELSKVPYDLVTIVFPEKPIEYGALDEKEVDILFFLFATEDKSHLHLLSKIAHLSSNSKALELLRSQPDKSVLLDFIRTWEGGLRSAQSTENVF